MKKFTTITVIWLSFTVATIHAQSRTVVFGNGAIAPGETIEFSQPDNSTLRVKLRGDAVINWLETEEGYKLAENESGFLEYATSDAKGNMIPSGYIASNTEKRTRTEVDFLNTINKDIFYSEEQLELKRNMAVYGKSSGEKLGGFPATGNRKLLVILARFSDQPFTYAQSAFNNLFNAANYGSSGCFKDYFYEVSYGQLVVTTTVTQIVTLPNTRSYYGANTSGPGSDSKAALAVRHAIQAAYNAGVSFSPFDNNNDGTIDLVAVIHSGLGEETSGNTADIWSHNWSLSASGYGSLTLGGKTFNNYTMQPEKYTSGTMTNIGVICHEFGHAIGLPDFYDTNSGTGGSYSGTGDWDLMASGVWLNSGRKPAHPNAWCKIYLGWVSPVTLSAAANVTLKNVEQNKQIYRINTSVTNDYFLLENRQKTGFDTYIPQSGLLIYHVHPQISSYISNNTVNTTHPQRMYIVPAGSTTDPKAGNYGSVSATSTPYPGSLNKTSFTDNTVPNMKTWSGANVNKPITNITHNTSTKEVSFKFMGGGTSGGVPTATTDAASNITTTSARINGTVNANNNSTSVSFLVGTSSTNLNLTYNATPAAVSGTSSTAVYYNLTGLNPQTVYYFRIKVVYNGTTLLGSILSFTTSTQGGGTNLPTATTLAATNLTSSTVKLNGQVKANNLSTTVKFQIWTSSNSSSPWEFNASPASVSGNTNTSVSVTLGSLTAGVTYYFRVKATNNYGTVTGSTLSFKISSNALCEPVSLLNPEVTSENTDYEQNIHMTSIESENENTDFFKVFPNPSSDYIAFDNNEGFTKISIFDLSGRLIWKEDIINEGIIKINIRNFVKGSYIIIAKNATEVKRCCFVAAR